jgi:hypothetical protein
MSDVDVPAVGRVDRQWVVAGVAVTAGIVGVAWWRHRQAATSAAPTVDPTTGTDSTNPTYTNPNPVVSSDTGGQLPPANNQEWSQRALDKLSWFESGYLGDILGKYLGRQPLSLEEAAVVRTVWAIIGHPPQDVPIILATSGGSTPGTPPPPSGGGTSKPGAVTGLHASSGAFNTPPGGGLSNNYIDASWNAVTGATSYDVLEESPYGRTPHTATGTGIRITGLAAPDTTHRITVTARNSAGSGPSASTTVHTNGHFAGPRPPVINPGI